MKNYKDTVSLEKRVTESKSIISKYPDYVPVIIDSCEELSTVIKKRKYLVPKDVMMSYFLCILKQKMTWIDSKKALIMFCGNKMLNPTQNIGVIYQEYLNCKKHDDDMYLYIFLSAENTFG